jgi:penicillin G amidase
LSGGGAAGAGAGSGSDPERGGGSNNWVVAASRSARGAPLLANDPHRLLADPSLSYLVHLNAPGWNVIGAAAPWKPGVAIGHNERVAWGMTLFNADVQDLYVERVNPADAHQVEERGRWVDNIIVRETAPVRAVAKPFQFEREYTRHGVVIGIDRERNVAFALRWTGAEPGTAPCLGALALNRARSAAEFRDALAHWRMPGANFVYADVDGTIGYQAAALTPVRRAWNGTLPVPGWSGAYEWDGFYALDDLPHAGAPANGYLATANNNTLPPNDGKVINYEWGRPARINRIRQAFGERQVFDLDSFRRLQHDVLSWNAEQLVPLLAGVHGDTADLEEARVRLLAWDKRLTADSSDATLYVAWEHALLRKLVEGRLDPALVPEYVDGGSDGVDVLVPAITRPSNSWFGRDPVSGRDRLLVDALRTALADLRAIARSSGSGEPSRAGSAQEARSRATGTGTPAWGTLHTVLFEHPLAITEAARRRFNVGPFESGGYVDTVMATFGPRLQAARGPSFREVIDLGNWDASMATNAPGQSGWPASPHFADLATLWAAGEYFPLAFSDAAVQANAETTLTLTPRVRR